MSQWEVQPYTGIYGLQFGQSRSEIRQFLSGSYRSFRKVSGALETDIFSKLGLRLDYDKEERLEFIEMVLPAKPKYQEISLLETEEALLVEKLTNLGFEPVVESSGYNFPTLGLAIYKEDGFIQSISIYRKGYYD